LNLSHSIEAMFQYELPDQSRRHPALARSFVRAYFFCKMHDPQTFLAQSFTFST
jgi:hypothetical protein